MTNETTLGYNDNKQIRSLSSFIVPSVQELLLFFVLSLVFIFLTSITTIWYVLTHFSDLESVNLSEALAYQEMIVNPYIMFSYLGDFTVFFVWGVIGCVSYMLVWGLQHLFLRLKEDKDESQYAHVDKKNIYWRSRASQHVFFAATIITFISYSLLFLTMISFTNALAKITLLGLSSIQNYIYFFAAVGVSIVYLYVFTRLWRVLRYMIAIYFAGTEE